MANEGIYRSRVAAAALAVFAGGFGAHRFFLGQWWGVFYLLLFWTYVPFLIGLIEGIVFIATDQESWNRKHNNGVSAGKEPVLVVAIFAIALPLIAAVGILAAIAIPAYHDYTIRARTSNALVVASSAKLAVEEFVAREQRWPESLEETSYQSVIDPNLRGARFDPQHGLILQIYAGSGAEGEVQLIPQVGDGGISWTCQPASIDPRYLPASCR
jgi:TM2 domain-containing membrane protein YozV/type II secretory pathway pseudopilin PulG